MMTRLDRRSFLDHAAGAAALTALLHGAAGVRGAEGSSKGGTPPHVPEHVQELLAELEATQARFYNVPRLDGQFLNLATKLARARSVLEIGTANGYSGIWLSLALEETGGKLTTIEIVPDLVQAAKTNLKRARLEHRVTFLEGDAHEIVQEVEGPFDLVFIDAELGGKMDYFRKIYPAKLPPGGLIVVHNAIRYRSAMQDYLDFIRAHRDFDSVVLSLTMEDGFAVSYRRRGAG